MGRLVQHRAPALRPRLPPTRGIRDPPLPTSGSNEHRLKPRKPAATKLGAAHSVFYQQFLQRLEDANPTGQIWIVTDNLSSHNSLSTRTWLEDHPRIHHAFIPVGACWLNLQEGWWRIFRKAALAGRSFANPDDIAYATTLATSQLNSRAKPWIWGRPAPPTRRLRRRYVYRV